MPHFPRQTPCRTLPGGSPQSLLPPSLKNIDASVFPSLYQLIGFETRPHRGVSIHCDQGGSAAYYYLYPPPSQRLVHLLSALIDCFFPIFLILSLANPSVPIRAAPIHLIHMTSPVLPTSWLLSYGSCFPGYQRRCSFVPSWSCHSLTIVPIPCCSWRVGGSVPCSLLRLLRSFSLYLQPGCFLLLPDTLL